MSFETEIASTNEHFFFSEFTYSQTTFRPKPGEELELCDHALWIDDSIILYQLKERSTSEELTPETERRWFQSKVLKRATRQIRDSLRYLDTHETIELTNRRGDEFSLERSEIRAKYKVVCYLPSDELPNECRAQKFHRSQTAGVIHLFHAEDYLGVVKTLLTPSEFSEYLDFREQLIDKWGSRLNQVTEQGLLGQFLAGDDQNQPDNAYCKYVTSLDHGAEEWDLSGIIKRFPQRTVGTSGNLDYYKIVQELAKLRRNELREFKRRFLLSKQKCQEGKSPTPYRIYSPRTDCAFVFVPFGNSKTEERVELLKTITYLCKYDLRAQKCIGMSFASDAGEWFLVEWCLMEFQWEYDEELDQKLKDNNPFREVKLVETSRYSFDV